MNRPRTVPGLLLEVARLRLGRNAPRAIAATGLALGVGLIAAGVGRLHEKHAVPAVASRALSAMHAGESGSGLTVLPALVWNGDGFGLSWVDGRAQRVDVYFERLSREGRRIGNEVAVTRGEGQHLLPRIAYTGTEYGIAWTDVVHDGEELAVGFARVGADGARRGDPMRLSAGDGFHFGAAVASDGRAYGITWNSVTNRGEVALSFARVVPGERPSAVRVLERNALPIGLSAIAWDGREFGLSYPNYDARRDRVEARLLRASTDGRALGTLALGDAAGMGGLFALAPAASGLAVSWCTLSEEGDASLWFARARGERVDVRARALRAEPVLPVAPSIAWTGDALGVAWTEQLPDRVAVSFARVSREGVVMGTPVSVSSGPLGAEPSIAWTGSEFAIAWVKREGRALTIQLTRFDAAGQRVGGDVEVASVR